MGICQKKLVRLGGCNRAYYGIWKASKNKIPRSPLVAEAWRAQEHWVNYACRVFLLFLYSNFFNSGSISTWRVTKSFSLSSLISSLITRLGIILCLHLSSLTLVFYIYCLLFIFMHQSSIGFLCSFTLVSALSLS